MYSDIFIVFNSVCILCYLTPVEKKNFRLLFMLQMTDRIFMSVNFFWYSLLKLAFAFFKSQTKSTLQTSVEERAQRAINLSRMEYSDF